MIVEAQFQYQDGSTEYRIVDWNNRKEVRDFAIAAREALAKNATVTTKRIVALSTSGKVQARHSQNAS